MWRKCDLHRHTTPDSAGEFDFDPRDFVERCVRDGLDVVAVTDHDRTDRIDAVVQEAADHDVIVVPGVEISTDRGHVLALGPGVGGREILDALCSRVPVMEGRPADFNRLSGVLTEPQSSGGETFRNHVILIGAHVDASGSILGSGQTHSVDDQASSAQQLQALEVVEHQNLTAWRRGIKQTDVVMALLQGSDAHPTAEYEARSTWIYLPDVTAQWFRHALATHEASISHQQEPPPEPGFWIRSVRFEDGQYSGRRIDFSPRANALIGPPSSGKSLIIDAIRYVFDIPCAIDDVQSLIERRLAKCLPDGTTVVVEIESGDGQRELRRVRGGTTVPESQAKPIVFSQSELARRSMEPTPSLALLDIHCPEGAAHRREIDEVSEKVRSAFSDIVGLATQARELRLEVENEQEGLKATQARYLDLVGDEETAKSLGDLGRIENWHKVAGQRLKKWREEFQIPAGPELPTAPQLATGRPVADYVPSDVAPEALKEYRSAVREAADKLVEALHRESAERSSNVESLRADVQARLGGEQGATPELAAEVEQYKTRLSELEEKAGRLSELDKKISDDLEAIDKLIDQASEARANLRQARRVACTVVNDSMPSFFVRLSPDVLTTSVDELLNDLKVGTHLQDASVQGARDGLDRKAFVRAAIGHVQFPASDDDQRDLSEAAVDARRIARVAMDRTKHDGIAKLATLWPNDGIEILQKQKGDDPVPFDDLTEGLKALAIKEISFAASQLPAVTDQPEDAVPTTAVFKNLVPTVREQRVSRQFIIASHDANVVVSGDMERVIVLPPEASEPPIAGTLFDAPIRERAIALLEGGNEAFELRRRRYGDYG